MSGAQTTQNTAEGEEKPVYPNMPVVNTIQPFIGNNAQLIAAQLAAGGYGTPEQLTAQGQQIYAPTHSVGLFEPLTETAAALDSGDYNTGSTGLIALDRVLGAGGQSSKKEKNGGSVGKSGWDMGNLAKGHPGNPFGAGR